MPFQTHNPRSLDVWTVERISILLRLDAEDTMSRSQIANQLFIETGSRFTRNAVIGKLARLGVPKKERPISARKTAIRIAERIAKRHTPPEKKQRPPAILNPSLRLSLTDLTSTTCKFITSGDDQPTEYCGHSISERSYCAAHYQICYYSPRTHRPDVSHRMRVDRARLYKKSILKPTCEAA
jgi:hypothetical protein